MIERKPRKERKRKRKQNHNTKYGEMFNQILYDITERSKLYMTNLPIFIAFEHIYYDYYYPCIMIIMIIIILNNIVFITNENEKREEPTQQTCRHAPIKSNAAISYKRYMYAYPHSFPSRCIPALLIDIYIYIRIS